MAHQPDTDLFSLLGFVIWGDLGDNTIYRDKRGRIVAFAKTWPHKQPSPSQLEQRQRFTDAATAWQALTPQQRLQWNTAAPRACLCAHGYDVFVHWHLTQDHRAIQTLQHQTSTNLLPP
jgi:hypothetical protein